LEILKLTTKYLEYSESEYEFLGKERAIKMQEIQLGFQSVWYDAIKFLPNIKMSKLSLTLLEGILIDRESNDFDKSDIFIIYRYQ
jgi:hypothetical protein